MEKKETGVYRRKDNKFGWRIVAANGKVVAGDAGQGYSRRIDAEEMFSRFTYTETNGGWIDLSSIELHGDSPEAAVAYYASKSPRAVAIAAVNDRLNRFIRENNESDDEDPAIRYFGWWWRSVDFFTPRGVTIARGEGMTAVCENNKWGYDQRSLTEAEQAAFLALVWDAWVEGRKGGILSEIDAKTHAALELAGAFIASLDVPPE